MHQGLQDILFGRQGTIELQPNQIFIEGRSLIPLYVSYANMKKKRLNMLSGATQQLMMYGLKEVVQFKMLKHRVLSSYNYGRILAENQRRITIKKHSNHEKHVF